MKSANIPGYDRLQQTCDDYLAKLSEARYREDGRLSDAVRYVLAGQGKRVRAVLAQMVYKAIGGKVPDDCWPTALAVEMIHTYSLVHDDLPSMDDDDLRRGRPTAHVAFDEALALLAGDALLSDAFLLISHPESFGLTECRTSAQTRIDQITELALAAGVGGMVSGQALDLEYTGGKVNDKKIIDDIHLKKTGFLIGASCSLGAIAANAHSNVVEEARQFGRSLGLAFQIIDDVLDVQDIGKSVGKDAAAGKLTYLRAMDHGEALHYAQTVTEEAIGSLTTWTSPQSRHGLDTFARELLRRNQ